jgi:30S ribosomal protein S31
MGKGDKKTRRGKIWIGSFGVSRPKKKKNKKSGLHITDVAAGESGPVETKKKPKKK